MRFLLFIFFFSLSVYYPSVPIPFYLFPLVHIFVLIAGHSYHLVSLLFPPLLYFLSCFFFVLFFRSALSERAVLRDPTAHASSHYITALSIGTSPFLSEALGNKSEKLCSAGAGRGTTWYHSVRTDIYGSCNDEEPLFFTELVTP
jgi:hypothetical protein